MKTIGIVALSGAVEKEKIERACLNLEKIGFRVKLSSHVFDKTRYLAASDDIKVQELHKFFEDNEVDIILNARGGYGSIRILNKIDYEIIKRNPKPFVGFSDITALLLMIYKNSGLVTYHGPMASSDFSSDEISEFTLKSFFTAINGEEQIFEAKKVYNEGAAQGLLLGGNLSTIVSLCGLDFIPNEDFIFFAEDLNEPVYKLDKMFWQLFNIEKFRKHCKAIALGDFLYVDNEEWLEDFFNELAQNSKIPMYSGFRITHATDKITIPIGRMGYLEGNSLRIN